MRVRSLVALAAISVIAACTDSPVDPSQIKVVPPQLNHSQVVGSTSYKTGPMKVFLPVEIGPNGAVLGNVAGQSAGTSTAPPQLDIQYWGGGVIHRQKFAAIYYSPTRVYSDGPRPGSKGDGENDRSLVGYFLNNLGESSYWNINSTYYDVVGNRRSFIKNTMDYSSFWAANDNAPHPGGTVFIGDMINLIETGFATGALKYNPNTLYMIFTGPGVNLGGGFSSTGLSYCAFHSAYWYTDGTHMTQFAAMPYDADFNPDHPSNNIGSDGKVQHFVCTFLTRGINNDLGADATVSGMAHETEETATDPVSLINGEGFFAGWYDANFEENGDKCAYIYGPTLAKTTDYWNMRIGRKRFLVQQNWSNVAPQGCLTGLKGGKESDNGGGDSGGGGGPQR